MGICRVSEELDEYLVEVSNDGKRCRPRGIPLDIPIELDDVDEKKD